MKFHLGGIVFLNFAFYISGYFATDEPSLKIGSFNIQTLGPTKIANKTIVTTICQILSRYDIVAIQEIRDSNMDFVMTILIDQLNDFVQSKGIKYSYTLSHRLGFTSYKEIYAFVYRNMVNGLSRRIVPVSQMVYENSEKIFDRPPFIVEFKIFNTTLSLDKLTLMNIHLRPSFVLEESLGLRQVVDWYNQLNNNIRKHIVILGDFNFDCSYISQSDRNQVRDVLSDFTWFIRDNYATTISTRNCAYDRIIVNSQLFINSIIPETNMTFRYDHQFGLSSEYTKRVSDHFPVEIEIN